MAYHSILLVEDNEDDVFFFKDALHRTGIDLPVEIASDGQQAIDHLIAASAAAGTADSVVPGVVLLDLNLPRQTGLDVLKWIRQQPRWKTLIVIVLTSSTSDIDMHQAYTLGANSYIVKPTNATKLRELIQLLKSYWFGWNQSPPATRQLPA